MLHIIITSLEPLLNSNAVSSAGVVVTLERSNLLTLRSNCNFKKYRNEKIKKTHIKTVKRCRDGMPKSMQTR